MEISGVIHFPGAGSMFRGSCLLTVDDKGRIAVPARFREILTEQCDGHVVTTMYQDRAVAIYPWPVWLELEQRLQDLPSGDVANRALQEMLLGHADERQLDGQGRLLIAPSLRQYAGLEREAKLLGQSHKLVLWSAQTDEQRYENWARVLNDPELAQTVTNLKL